jgi:hypothetical protein
MGPIPICVPGFRGYNLCKVLVCRTVIRGIKCTFLQYIQRVGA